MRYKLLLIVALALMSGACATTQPVYHAVDGTSFTPTLIPPVSTTEPAVLPPDVIDDLTVECPPELNCDPKLTVTKTPRPPVAPSTEVLKSQINNLLAQVDSLQNVAKDRRPAKLERYARELAATKAELKAAQTERDAALNNYISSKQETAILERASTKLHALLAAKRYGDMQWNVITWKRPQDKTASLRDWLIGGALSFITLLAFVYVLGLRNGKIKAQDFASARIIALESAIDGRKIYITELKETIEKKNTHIAELEQLVKDGFLSRPSKPLPTEPPAKSLGKKNPRKAKARARPPKKPPVADPLAGPTRAMPTEPAVKVSVEFGSLPLEEPIKG